MVRRDKLCLSLEIIETQHILDTGDTTTLLRFCCVPTDIKKKLQQSKLKAELKENNQPRRRVVGDFPAGLGDTPEA